MSNLKKNAVQAPKIDRRTRMKIAFEAGVDLRTVERALAGSSRPIPITAKAIADAMRVLGVSS